jgi:hypothetical protein
VRCRRICCVVSFTADLYLQQITSGPLWYAKSNERIYKIGLCVLKIWGDISIYVNMQTMDNEAVANENKKQPNYKVSDSL